MSQIGNIEINYNVNTQNRIYPNLAKSFIVGVSQRGPIYKPTTISNLNKFLLVFGQPTNSFEFDFFQAVKSVVTAGGIAVCYRIPYTDNKDLDSTVAEFYIGVKISGSYEIAFRDEYHRNDYYYLGVQRNPRKQNPKFDKDGIPDVEYCALYLMPVENPHTVVDYIYMRQGQYYYKIFVSNKRLFAQKEGSVSSDEYIFSDFYVKYVPTDSYEFCLRVNENATRRRMGLYLYKEKNKQNFDFDKTIYDVIYKSNSNYYFDYSEGAKLTFTLINDFNSVLIPEYVYDKDTDAYALNLNKDKICDTIKSDIDPEQIIGVFPIFFGTKDAENIRKLNFSQLHYYNNHTKNYIHELNVYPCSNDIDCESYRCEVDGMLFDYGLFSEFERAPHFKRNWLEREIAKLVDTYVPQNINECRNTLGVAFYAFYLNDEHKIDYKLLESYYGLVGLSNSKFKNLEDLINKYSNFFRVSIDGTVKNTIFTRALNEKSLCIEENRFVVPCFAPMPAEEGERNIVNMDSIFAYNPSVKCHPIYSKPLSKLFDKLKNTEYLNSSPYDYILAPGMEDIILLEEYVKRDIDNEYDSSSLVPFTQYQVNLNGPTIPYDYFIGGNYSFCAYLENVKSFQKLLSIGTGFGDKGTIGIIDVPKVFNDYFKDYVGNCHSDESLTNLLGVLNSIYPNFSRTSEVYDRTYPVFNYQYVDKDSALTRYHKFTYRKNCELVPASAMVIGAYNAEFNTYSFDPIAGPRNVELFNQCHKCYMDMNRPEFFKFMFDLYGISSLMNDFDNGTFPIQQTTWKKSTSVLKQLHAFRIYVEIRRRVYDIAKSYLYEPNTEFNITEFQNKIDVLLKQFKENYYIDNPSYARVWATIPDIEQHQVHVLVVIGIFGAIVKIVVNMNLQNMTIEVV